MAQEAQEIPSTPEQEIEVTCPLTPVKSGVEALYSGDLGYVPYAMVRLDFGNGQEDDGLSGITPITSDE